MQYSLAQLFKEPTGSTRDYIVDESFIGPEDGLDRAQGWVRVTRTHEGFLVRAFKIGGNGRYAPIIIRVILINL